MERVGKILIGVLSAVTGLAVHSCADEELGSAHDDGCRVTSTPDGGATIECGDSRVTVPGRQPWPNVRVEGELDQVLELHYGGDIVIDSPGALAATQGYTHIDGDLVYSSSAPVDTVALPHLLEVSGRFVLHDNRVVRDLRGLPRLRRVGELVITNNTALEQLNDLQSLAQVDGAVTIANNPVLTSIDGLSGVGDAARGTVGGPLTVSHNERLGSLRGFGNFVRLRGDIVVADNPALPLVSGFAHAEKVDGTVYFLHLEHFLGADGFASVRDVGGIQVSRNARLQGFAGFTQLERVQRDLQIIANPLLETFTAFPALQEVGGEVGVASNPALRGFHGLGAVASLGALDVASNNALTTLTGLARVSHVHHDVVIHRNPALGHLDALGALAIVEGDLRIVGNGALERLDGLRSLSQITGALEITDNPVLFEPGLQALAVPPAHITIERNPRLPALLPQHLRER